MVVKTSKGVRILRIVGLGAALIAFALSVSACGEDSIDQAKAQNFLKDNLPKIQQHEIGSSSKAQKVSCPDGVSIEKGKTFTCDVSYEDGYKAAVTVHMTDDKGTITAAPRDFAVKGKSAKIADKGNFLLNVYAGQGDESGFEDQITQGEIVELVKELNSTVALPRNVAINFGSDVDGPAYDPSSHKIDMPYSFAGDTFTLFDSTGQYSQEESIDSVNQVLKYVLLHESAHAFIHELDLPVVGREEDAADGLASTLLLVSEGDEGAQTAAVAADFWNLSAASRGDPTVEQFADEHGLDKQRFFNILCFIYGSNPEKFANLVGEGGLPENRAVRCPSEFAQSTNAWRKLLNPYLQQK